MKIFSLSDDRMTESPHEDNASFFSCVSRLTPHEVYTTRDAPKLTTFFLRAHTRLFEVMPDLESKTSSWSSEETDRLHVLIKGAVQSGKTNIITALALYMTMIHRQSVIILVRNITEDLSQFQDAWTAFLAEFEEFCAGYNVIFNVDDFDGLPPFYRAKEIRIKGGEDDEDEDEDDDKMDIRDALLHGPTLITVLTNQSQLKKVNAILRIVREDAMVGITILVDEVDQLLYTEGEKIKPVLDVLLSEADHIFGVTATTWKPLHDFEKKFFSTEDVYLMTPPLEYRGIMDHQYETIEEQPVKDKNTSGLVSDPDLLKFLLDHCHDAPIIVNRRGKDGILRKDHHPLLALINTERLIHKQSSLMEDIARHPQLEKKYTLMTYNASSITLYIPNLSKQANLLLPFSNKKLKRQGSHLIGRGASLRHVLQWLKNQAGWRTRFPRIVIIAQNMVGRGLNIVSHDYEWHLTDFFWRPSLNALLETRMQDQRGCGIFTDDAICRVHCTLEDERDLKKGHQIQEEIFQRWSGRESEEPMVRALNKMTFYKEKVPSSRMTRKGVRFGGITVNTPDDGGQTMEEFTLGGLIPEDDPEEEGDKKKPFTEEEDEKRLCEKMFRKWGSMGNNSKIGNFMRRLEPLRVYSDTDIKALCKNEGNHTVTLTHITQPYIPSHWIFGRILVGNSTQGYCLNPRLREAYFKFF